jgi:NitT/TauT family transport system substrate-binding protein
MTNTRETSMSSRALLTAVAALALAVGVGACGGAEEAAPSSGPDQVDVGVIAIVDVAPIYLGRQQGFFEAENIDLRLTAGQGGATTIAGVASGQFQFGFSNVTSLLLAQDKGLALKVVAAGNSTTGEVGKDFGAVVVPKDSPITTAAQLAGKKVAVNILNNIGTTTISKLVRDDGGDPRTIKFTELSFPDMPGAIANRQVDAALVIEPFLTISRQQGAVPVAWNYAGTDPKLMVAAYFTADELATSDPDLVQRFSRAMNRSLEFAAEHPEQVRTVLGSYTKIDQKVAAELTLPTFSTEINAQSFSLLGDLAVGDGLLSKQPDVKALLP